jgi:hypothetical protein
MIGVTTDFTRPNTEPPLGRVYKMKEGSISGICCECGCEIDVSGRTPLEDDEKWMCGDCIYVVHFGD